jgi:Tol biopolymer transport system component
VVIVAIAIIAVVIWQLIPQEQVVSVFSNKQRRHKAAQAQFGIGRHYENLGETDKAVGAYRRVIRDYDDQIEVVAEALARLVELDQSIRSNMVVREVWVPADDVMGMPSHDGRYLTYVDWLSANLAVRDLTTGKTRHLTDEGTWMEPDQYANYSVWSSDDKKIAYAWFNKDVWELRLVGFDGFEPHVLYRNEEVKYLWPYEWTQDDRYILTWFRKEDSPSEIGLVSVADGSVRVLKSRLDSRIDPVKMSISPDGRYIVYDLLPRKDSSQRDIFLLTMDGSREIPLIEHSATDYGPVWTPDGKQIVFISDRLGNPAVWALEVVDGKPQGSPQLIEQNMNRMVPMGFTRNGSFYYAFQTYMGHFMGDVYITTLDPTTGKVLTPPKKIPQRFEGTNASPDWSPDGKYLAYVSVRGLASVERVGSCVLVIRSVETGKERELPLKRRGNIRWSPDGRSILVYDYEEVGGDLYLISAETGDITPVAQGKLGINIQDAELSLDRKQVFYLCQHRERSAYTKSIVVHNLETGEEKELSREDCLSLALSPDSQQLAFCSFHVLHLMPTMGGEPRQLLRLPPSERFPYGIGPAWTPDGRYIIVAKGRNLYQDDPEADTRQLFELWRIPVEGGEVQKLGFAMKEAHELSIHPDGRQIAFTRPGALRLFEVWAMENFLPKIKATK